jgi:hypothetical protein
LFDELNGWAIPELKKHVIQKACFFNAGIAIPSYIEHGKKHVL